MGRPSGLLLNYGGDKMKGLVSAYISPHPPIIVENIGRGEEKKCIDTINGLMKIAEDIENKKPETIIVITPHGPLFSDAIAMSIGEELYGDFGNFGHSELKYHFKNDLEIVQSIYDMAKKEGIQIALMNKEMYEMYGLEDTLDHGVLVPMHFVTKKYTDFKLVHITYGLLSPIELYKFGNIIEKIAKGKRNISIIASGDLSHRLLDSGPYSYSPKGKEFDEKIISLFKNKDLAGVISFDLDLAKEAGECGLRSFMILAGALSQHDFYPHILSYEGPFGVGYMTAIFEIMGESSKDYIEEIKQKIDEKIKSKRANEDKYQRLARESLEYYIKNRKYMDIPEYVDSEMLSLRMPVFVSIKKFGELRGCIGSTSPIKRNIAEEIIYFAVEAGTKDPRFSPVTEEELPFLSYSVDVLYPPKKVKSIDELDPKKYGIIVESGFKKGLLLPDIEGVDTVRDQIRIALNKAGIDEHEKYEISKFEVIRHG